MPARNFNPNHDPKDGEFTSGGGGSGPDEFAPDEDGVFAFESRTRLATTPDHVTYG